MLGQKGDFFLRRYQKHVRDSDEMTVSYSTLGCQLNIINSIEQITKLLYIGRFLLTVFITGYS